MAVTDGPRAVQGYLLCVAYYSIGGRVACELFCLRDDYQRVGNGSYYHDLFQCKLYNYCTI